MPTVLRRQRTYIKTDREMAMEEDKDQFSTTLSNVLDVMGYSYAQIKNGQAIAGKLQDSLNQEYQDDLSVFMAGSKKEGLSFLELNSDLDLMFIFNNVMCYHGDSENTRSRSDSGASYVIDIRDTPPGYAMLVVDEMSNDNNDTLHIYSTKSHKKYFSSELISSVMSTLTKHHLQFENTTEEVGPSKRKPTLAQLGKYTDILADMKKQRQTSVNKTNSGNTTSGATEAERVTVIYDRKEHGSHRHHQNTADEEKQLLEDLNYVDTVCSKVHGNDLSVGTERLSDVHEEKLADKQSDNTVSSFDMGTINKENTADPVQSKPFPTNIKTNSMEPEKNTRETLIQTISRAGPSQATEYKHPLGTFLSQDNVIAFPAKMGDYLQQWCSRKRFHGFPTADQIAKISQMDGHVVPVGCKKAEDSDLQWRICFTFGEVELLQSLNGTQYKLYVLLKHLAKQVIKVHCPKVITSYVMKNVVLWMAELKPSTYFRDTNLVNCLVESMYFLKMCVVNGFIPNYMIHSRNLIQDKLSPNKAKILGKLLKTLVSERGSMVMRCENIRNSVKSPYFKYFSSGSDTLRRACSEVFRMFYDPDIGDDPLNNMELFLSHLVSSIERSYEGTMKDVKFQSMIALKFIENWITELPDKCKENVTDHARLRQRCSDLKRQISVSFTRELTKDPSYRWLLKFIASLQVDNVSSDAVATFVSEDSFVNELADKFVQTCDVLGAIDDRQIGHLLTNPMQMMLQTAPGAEQLTPNQEYGDKKTQDYSDFDLD